MEQFTSKIADEIQYYVYALVDPRNDQIFYIGKGKGKMMLFFKRKCTSENRRKMVFSFVFRSLNRTFDATRPR